MSEAARLETVIVTSELGRRPARAPDHAAESRALVDLLQALNAADGNVLQVLADHALALCGAESAGVSIAEEADGAEVFRWRASAGTWSQYLGGTIRRDASPCGVVVERDAPLLMQYPERYFAGLVEGAPAIAEVLLVPFRVAGRAVGTVWVTMHADGRRFDAEDLRLLGSLANVAALALQQDQQKQRIAEALDREVEGLRMLQSISLGLIAENDAGALYRQIVVAATKIMHSQFASLQMLDRDGLQLLAWSGFHPESAAYWRSVPRDSASCCGVTLRAGERSIVADCEAEPSLRGSGHLVEFRRSGIRAMQSTPLFSRSGKLVGVVSTHWRQPHVPGESDLRLLDVLAREAADLIERTGSEAALRAADRRKDEFLAILGHELRNPLAPLATGLDVLENSGGRTDIVPGIHAMMRRQVRHLSRLVDDLLDLARIGRGDVTLQRAPMDLRIAIAAAVDIARPAIAAHQHRLDVDAGTEPLGVHGDLHRLTQVVANLLGNAAKYMDDDGAIELRAERDGDEVVLRVRDTGFGIPAERLDAIFELFSQVPEHRERTGGGGLGIGLALARRLVELHGGTLGASSDGPGRGSEFVVRLPRRDIAVVATDPRERPATAAAARRVLVVDDNADAARSLHELLTLEGHEVEVAGDGHDGLARFDAFAPEVVLLDIAMPGMDGYAVCRHIRAVSNGHGPLVVAVTGWGQPSDRERALAAGFDMHLTKPVDLGSLRELLAVVPRG